MISQIAPKNSDISSTSCRMQALCTAVGIFFYLGTAASLDVHYTLRSMIHSILSTEYKRSQLFFL